MPLTEVTLQEAARMRAAVGGQVDGVTRELVAAWADAWDVVVTEWNEAVEALVEAGEDGRWPTAAKVVRVERAQRAMETTEKALRELTDYSSGVITGATPRVVTEAAEWEARLIGSQMPAAAGPSAVAGIDFNRVDPLSLEAIVGRTTQQITALHYPISAEATAAIQRELIRGVVLGKNPRAAAGRMVRRVEGRFNGGLGRALNVARTEMLDAHRTAAQAQDLANADVVTSWQWLATLDTRTCPSCLAQHGSTHPIDEVGPLDHQQGRCARVPVTPTWEEMGFRGIPEPPAAQLPDARAWYDQLPEAQQTKIMGDVRRRLLHNGDVGWDDLSTRRSSAGWRDSFTPTPVRDLEER